MRWQRGAPKKPSPWIGELLARRPTNVVLVAMANKTARTVWAMMRDQQNFNAVLRYVKARGIARVKRRSLRTRYPG